MPYFAAQCLSILETFCLWFISTCKPEATWVFHSVKFLHLQNNLGLCTPFVGKPACLDWITPRILIIHRFLCVASLEIHSFTPRTRRTRVSKLPVYLRTEEDRSTWGQKAHLLQDRSKAYIHLSVEGRPIQLMTEGRSTWEKRKGLHSWVQKEGLFYLRSELWPILFESIGVRPILQKEAYPTWGQKEGPSYLKTEG